MSVQKLAMEKHLYTILLLLQQHGKLTKPEVTILTDLPVATVHNAFAKLLSCGLIRSCGSSCSNGGRRASYYELNEEYGAFAAFQFKDKDITAGLFSVNGTLIASQSIQISIVDYSPEAYMAKAAMLLSELQKKNGITKTLFACASVSIPVQDGKIQFSAMSSRWRNVCVSELLENVLKIPVVTEKTGIIAAEYLIGSGKSDGESAVMLTINDTISSILLCNGKVYSGSRSLAGEIGHIQIKRDGPACRCGNTGCVELFCSDSGLIRQCSQSSGVKINTIDEFMNLIRQGNTNAQRALTQAVRYLAEITASLYMTLGPKEIFIYCKWLKPHVRAYRKLTDSILERSIFSPGNSLSIQILEDDCFILNAVGDYARKSYFRNICHSLGEQ